MKKIIICMFIITIMFISTNKEEIVIPNESIRLRIIASSSSLEDQNIKYKIKEDIINNFMSKVLSNTYSKTSSNIKNNLPLLDEIIKKYNVEYKINYGDNYFPDKTYKGIKYNHGIYNSLVITLGKGLGNNFWCVMYPPLCLIDDNNSNNIEYKFLAKEILLKYNN